MNVKNRTIFCQDNLLILRGLDTKSIDLIYLDPPFNSNRNYSAPIGMKKWRVFSEDKIGIIAEAKPTEMMWRLWRRDRRQIKALSLQPRKTGPKTYIAECYCPILADLLVACSN